MALSDAVQGGKWALDGDNGRSIFGDGVFASHFDWTTYYFLRYLNNMDPRT